MYKGHVDCYKEGESSARIGELSWAKLPLLRIAVAYNLDKLRESDFVYKTLLNARTEKFCLVAELLNRGAFEPTTSEVSSKADVLSAARLAAHIISQGPIVEARPRWDTSSVDDDLAFDTCDRLSAWLPRAEEDMLVRIHDATSSEAASGLGQYSMQRDFDVAEVVDLEVPTLPLEY